MPRGLLQQDPPLSAGGSASAVFLPAPPRSATTIDVLTRAPDAAARTASRRELVAALRLARAEAEGDHERGG